MTCQYEMTRIREVYRSASANKDTKIFFEVGITGTENNVLMAERRILEHDIAVIGLICIGVGICILKRCAC